MDGLGFCRWVALGAGIDDVGRRSTGKTFTFLAVRREDSFGGLEAALRKENAEGKVVVVVPQGNREVHSGININGHPTDANTRPTPCRK